ncbi:GPI ethanolamine phosphate transferase 1 [Frankliniella fusca]|uniref:GPI ethanolamine phosphate transferase 1 n=1 Tax=Frankliniella fusca TaxID=407009 RepID=A0AAE1HS23_9NEOP|nr:GPI ethanolamine phosphate transferase 1 [Frankliniella fusca]
MCDEVKLSGIMKLTSWFLAFLLMCATVSWMSCIVRLTQNGYILCISSCLGGSPLSKSSGVLMGAPNITS